MKFYAGIVLYNPDINRLKENISSIYKQVDKVILIDNGSNNVLEVKDFVKQYKNVLLIENKDNLGIAKALNQICKYSLDNGAGWVLTLDQDSNCSPNMISTLSKYCDKQVGILCPDINYIGWSKKLINKEIDYVKGCMSSGSLTNVAAWKTVGGFKEEYFIDYVDNEFCEKLILNNYKIIRTYKCIMNHHLGISGETKILKIKYCQHSPLRNYYMIRNNLLFIKEYKKHLNLFKEYVKIFLIFMENLLTNSEKKEVIAYTKLAISDYKKEIVGKFNH